MMFVEEHGLVFDSSRQPDSRRATAFCEVVRVAEGTLYCVFQAGPQKNDATATIQLCRSDDGGRVWRDLPSRLETRLNGVLGSLNCGAIVEAAPGRLLLAASWFDRSEPDRPLFDPETQGILHTKTLRAFSNDGGESWTAWDVVPTPGLSGCSLTGPIARWSNGTLGLALESYREFDDPTPRHHAAWLLISRDGGESFPERLLVAQHPEHNLYYWDQRLCVGPGQNELLGMFWTHDLRQKRDLNVHLRQTTLGKDGLVGSPPRVTTISGQIAAPLWLPDGRLLTMVVARDTPGTITLWQSSDGGATWPPDDALVVYEHDERALLSQGRGEIDYNAYWVDMARWSFGHPTLCRLDADHVLAVYYAGPPNHMSIHWARIRVSG